MLAEEPSEEGTACENKSRRHMSNPFEEEDQKISGPTGLITSKKEKKRKAKSKTEKSAQLQGAVAT